MFKAFLISIITALSLNFFAYQLSLDYLWSVILVFGGMTLLFSANAFKTFTKENWKLFSGFFIFSNICTLIVEIVMLKFDVWGFSNRVQQLSGYTFLSYPIEEFIYWAFCPGIVALSYMTLGKKFDKVLDVISYSKLISIISKIKFKKDSNINYTNDNGTGKYNSGNKFPVYIWLQILIISSIIYMRRYYRGNWKAMLYTTLIFFFTAFPNELYALSQGFWLYNDNKLLGIYFFKVPLEGFMMYFISPICAAMILDISNRFFFKKDN